MSTELQDHAEQIAMITDLEWVHHYADTIEELYSTPEQRREQYRRRAEIKQQFAVEIRRTQQSLT